MPLFCSIVQVVQERDVRFNILVNIALTLADDRIPNVRLALCTLLDELRGHIVDHSQRLLREQQGKTGQQQQGTGREGEGRGNTGLALRALQQLLQDPDKDVQHFAAELQRHVEADFQQYRTAMTAMTAVVAEVAGGSNS